MNTKNIKLLATMLLCFSGTTFAESNIDVITTISAGITNFEYDLHEEIVSIPLNAEYTIGDSTSLEFAPKLQHTEIGITLIDDNLYYGFSALITGQALSEDRRTVTTNAAGTSEFLELMDSTYSTYNLLLGYAISENFSAYAGLTSSSGNIGDIVALAADGPFIGARYGYRINSSSSLSLDVSYSSIDTEFAFRNIFNTGYKSNADTEGFSYALTWVKSLDRGRSFFIRLKLINLESQGHGRFRHAGLASTKLDAEQKITSFSVGMGF